MADLREWHHAQGDNHGHVNGRKLKHNDYTVGWICALQFELTAATAMLDSVHESLPQKWGDNNTYILGEMSGHNTVITCLPMGSHGMNSGAIVATYMTRSFPSIKTGLLVGIGGGAPRTTDIRLGDVVVSTEVIQYSYSRSSAESLERFRPHQAIMSAVSRLVSNHEMAPSRVPEIISNMLQAYPRLASFSRPDLPDKLFLSEYPHDISAYNDGCNSCDASQVIHRPPRDNKDPEFHYGRIASAPTVIKDGIVRDSLTQQFDVLCFDMEASGIMEVFPFLVIRGICDYSDSHKTKPWQAYAAATAAAYAKELLSVIPRLKIPESPTDSPSSTLDWKLPPGQLERSINPQIPLQIENHETKYNQRAELLLETPQDDVSPEESRSAFRKPMRPCDPCRISLKIEDEGISRFGVDVLRHRVFPGNGLPLAEILHKHTLTTGEKFTLAHAVSLAFWQLYNSQFISRSWNSHAIWLMLDRDVQADSEHPLLISYLSFRPDTVESGLNTLDPNNIGSPNDASSQVQALSIILLEIGLSRPFRPQVYDKQAPKSTWGHWLAMEYLDELKSTSWDANAQRNIFADTVRECIEFTNLEVKGASSDIGPLRAPPRTFLYNRVITRLEQANRLFQKTNPNRYIENPQPLQDTQPLGAHASSMGIVSIADVSHSSMQSQPAKHMRPVNRFDFKVAIFCALTLEADAIEAIFDHQWDIEENGYGKSDGDHNAYSLGSIGSHNVVLAYMPGMGKGSAASVAANCRISFPNIKLAIVAGVCGVVPFAPGSRDEIILGDVVLSNGIIQYDFGKKLPQGFERKDDILDSLGRPQASVRALLAKLKGLRTRRLMLDRMASYLADLQNDTDLKANYPGAQHDILFESKYEHIKNGILCQDCGCNGTLVPRQRIAQDITSPAVHFGLIASGDLVMKSGEERDDISREESIIGFEMEGAGVWDNFPCLVIKGACDYADSHKPQAWQRYAAATAATCTKAVLHHWQP